METVPKVDVTGFKTPDRKDISDISMARFAGWAFLAHYGFFHFVYLIFLFTIPKTGVFDWAFYKMLLFSFAIGRAISFIQNRYKNHNKVEDISKMFFKPYLRIIPMHLCILIPAFLHFSNLTVFLVMKAVTDIGGYIITNYAIGGQRSQDKNILP